MSAPFLRTEAAPVLAVFGLHASRLAALLRVKPSLLPRLAYAPGRAIHAVGAFLHLAIEADLPDADVAAILEQTDPRDLLRAAIPEAPSRLYRLLDRAGDRVREQAFYERLGRLAVSPVANILLSAEVIDNSRLKAIERLLELDPALRSLPAASTTTEYELEALDALIIFLRAHDTLTDDDLVLPKGAALSAVVRRLQRGLDRVAAPVPVFSLPYPFRVIETVGDLRRLGRALRNCTGSWGSLSTSYWYRLADGSSVFVTTEDGSWLADVRHVGPELWLLNEISGHDNTKVSSDALSEALKCAGVRLLRQDPAHTLSALRRHMKDRRDDLALDEIDEDG